MAEDTPSTVAAAAAASSVSTPAVVPILSKARLHIIIVGLWLCLFISAMDTTIITTGLIKISSEFNGLSQAAWLITAYLLTYNAFLMITARLTDVWGLKTILLACNIFFLIFSMACGGAQSMIQLIVFRAFQGIGGSGLYSLVFVAVMKLVDPAQMGFYSGVVSSVFAIANLLGPVLGGIITDHTTWRWMFWINGPIVGTSIAILFLAMPGLKDGKSTRERLRNFDSLGGILSVCWPIPLLFALQEGGVHYEWNSGIVIGTLVTGLAACLLFGGYEAWVSYKTTKDPVFPLRFLTNPAMALLLLSMFLLGMPFYVAVIQLPQRFQSVNFTSAERAGILLLPVTMLTPVGAMVAGALMGKKFNAEYILVISTAIITIGVGLLGSLPVHSKFSNATYGYEVITGFGLGFASSAYYFLLYTTVEEKDAAVGTGALNMVRTLGGCVAIAICSALHHSVLKDDLPMFLNPEQIKDSQDNNAALAQLSAETRADVGRVFGKSYNRQFQVLLAFTCLNFLVAMVLVVVRKKKGIFGLMPVRREENEFMKAAEEIPGKANDMKEIPSEEKDRPQRHDLDGHEDSRANERLGS
ncbi:major facilitator superfamily domain-containing protein [Massariosphaeria phaeospora]|uniref:Major facilitator superfamily domain-containing protein n=1 Tax=Massariosphaeria phaeospora TaxID=100035 RepID=A0A7C8MEL9_9PLEO|nr:major facilitator superfamily domain-containing protein [Massariosphaeria phaeospora]